MDPARLPAVARHLRALAAGSDASPADAELLARFARLGDEAAFAALLTRHGPMVLRLCRRLLLSPEDAEDAFQATFLVLARKAASVRKGAAVASWLYGVAARTARKLRAARSAQARVGPLTDDVPATAPRDEPLWREVRAALDEELLRLPDRYRGPLLLCYAEGLTRDEAARRLGLTPNQLRARLDYGRTLLRGRLARRGLSLGAALLAGLDAAGAVPAALAAPTVKAAALLAAGKTVPPGTVPAHVLTLAERMARTMSLVSLKLACAAVVTVAAVLASIALASSAQSSPAADPPAAPPGRVAAGDPPKKKEVHPINKSLEGLAKDYALAEGEVLRAFRPPHPAARKEFFRVNRQPGDTTEWDGNLTLGWQDGALEFGSVTFGVPPRGHTILGLARSLADLAPEELEGDRMLRWATLIPGDFVARKGTPPAKLIARLEEILRTEYKLPVRLTLKEVDRTVYVLEGKYQFTPAAAGVPEHHIELYAKQRLDLPGPPGAPDDGMPFAECVQRLGWFIDRRVVLGKVEGLPAAVMCRVPIFDPATPEEWAAEHDPALVLKRFAEQTALSAREETRRVRVLLVERKE